MNGNEVSFSVFSFSGSVSKLASSDDSALIVSSSV